MMFGSSSYHNQQQQQQWSSSSSSSSQSSQLLSLSLSKPRQEIVRRHRVKAKQRTIFLLCLTVGIFFMYCYSILLSQFCLMSSSGTSTTSSFYEQQQPISRSLLRSSTSSTLQLQQQQQQQQQEKKNKEGGQRVVMAVLNGGIREVDYFSSLYEDLIELKNSYGYDLMILSDENNYNPNRVGEVRLSPFPVDKVFRKMSFGNDKMNGKLSLHQWRISIMWYSLIPLLLHDFPYAEAYWITENDAVICNSTKLVSTFDWFLADVTDNNNNNNNNRDTMSTSTKKSLSYWDSCKQSKKRNDTLATSLGLTLYEKNPCGMVATLLTKESLLKIQKNLHNSLFHWAIEGIFHSTKTMDASVENGEVLVHGGSISTSGSEWGEYTCTDPQGLIFKEKSKERAEAAISAGQEPKEYLG